MEKETGIKGKDDGCTARIVEGAPTVRTVHSRLLIIDLGWSKKQALETRLRLRILDEDWDAPGMWGYDDI